MKRTQNLPSLRLLGSNPRAPAIAPKGLRGINSIKMVWLLTLNTGSLKPSKGRIGYLIIKKQSKIGSYWNCKVSS